MAGFSQVGEPNYAINPPSLSSPYGSSGYLGLPVSRARRNYSPYFNNPNEGYNPGAENTAQHQANVYMSQMGMGNVGAPEQTGYSNYGFSPEDWANINRFLSNPQNQSNVTNYNNITGRLGQNMQTNPTFANWLPEQKQQFQIDAPIRLASGFQNVPAPILQNWGLAFPSGGAGNLRY